MIHIPLWKRSLVLITVIFGVLFAAPTFLSEKDLESLPEWLQEKVNLGLDLQGGSHLLLEVDVQSALRDQAGFLADDARKSLRKARLKFSNMRVEDLTVRFKIDNLSDRQAIHKTLAQQGVDTKFDEATSEFSMKFNEAEIDQKKKLLVQQSREIIERRINALGTREPNIQTQGTDRIIIQLPGVSDPGKVKDILGKTAKLTFQMVHNQYPTLNSTGGRVLPGTIAVPEDPSQVRGNREPVTYLVKKQILLTGESLSNAQPGFSENNAPVVTMRFDTVGARKFGEITKQYTHHQLAMILDGKVISAPNLNEPILGGNVQISGNFTVEETVNLSILLRAGSLPAPLNVLEERTVGPDLGADSVAAGENATVVAVVLVFVFMLVAYSLFGFFANIALGFNLVFLISALALTGSTLTLPGIAGIALTLGMAVDANVLILERIKEEIRAGTKLIQAIDAGYKRAMATIVDSNITTLIGGLALFFFGSGPVKGFGVTLCLGIVISMFTAITLTRILAVSWFKWAKPKTLPI